MNQVKNRDIAVAVIQQARGIDVTENLDQTAHQIKEVAQSGAQLVCLQELFASRYFCQTEDHTHFCLAEPIPGPTTHRLCQLAAQYQIVIVASLFEKRAPGLYHNSAIVIEKDGSIVGHYRKMHIPDDPFYYEKFYFTPGDLGFQAFSTSIGNVGVCICWDQWFPEAARLTALQGADFLVYPTAIGWLSEDKADFGASQLSAWQTMMRSHAIANGVFVVAPNRVGVEDAIEFWGHSFVCDPYGNLIAEASDQPQNLLVKLRPRTA